MSQTKPKSLLAVAPLFLVLFIDGMGLGLLFPILNSIIVDPSSLFLARTVSVTTRDLLYGLTISVFMICWFFGSAILGDLSDTIGRKKSLMICLLGACGGYFISAIGVIFHSLSLLIIGRIVAGFTAGSQPIAQAAIVDVSSEEHKARNLGLILLGSSLGFVFGPIIGGVLSNHQFAAWFNFSTPLFFAAIISLINAFLLAYLFKETFKITGKISIKLSMAVKIFVSAFQHKKVWKLSFIFLVMIFGWSNYFSFISMFMLNRYGFTAFENAIFLAVMGVGFSVGCGYLVDFCTSRFSKKNTVWIGFLASAIFAICPLIGNQIIAWIATLLIGMSIAVSYSVILAIFSDQVSSDEQGWVMGVTGAIMALCFGLTTFFTGLVASFGADWPLILATGGLTIAAVMMLFLKLNGQASNISS